MFDALIYNGNYYISIVPDIILLSVRLVVAAFLNCPPWPQSKELLPQLSKIGVECRITTLPLPIDHIAKKRTLK
jgi:hypothetical protein